MPFPLGLLVTIVNLAINILVILIIVDAVLSWVPDLRWRFRGATRWLDRITGPVLEPFRRLLPPSKTGGLDISPILAIVALRIIQQIVISALVR